MPPSVPAAPSRTRLIFAVIAVALLVVAVWKIIDYRQQPPPPSTEAATSTQ